MDDTPLAHVGDDPEELLALVLTGGSQADPFTVLDRLRELSPIHHSDQFGGWFLTRYSDCADLLRHPGYHQALSESLSVADPRFEGSAFLRNVRYILAFMNPPQHSRCRRLVARAFTPRSVEAARPAIEDAVSRALADIGDATEFDLHQMISRRIPGNVICQMMEIPVEDRDTLLRWSDTISHAVQPVIPDETLEAADRAVEAYWEYIVGLAEERRGRPGSDLISQLVKAEAEEGQLDYAEFVGVTHSLITGGIETAQGMLSSGVLGFLQNPRELSKVLENPELASAATEEALRLQSPVQVSFQRVALEDTSIGDTAIGKGEVVSAMIGAANHDPEAFGADAHAFRIDRPRTPQHLAFGNGIHYCVGAALARIEGEITFRELFTKMPDLQLAEDRPQWRPRYVIRSQERLMVRRSPADSRR
jgi:cytochrome P450